MLLVTLENTVKREKNSLHSSLFHGDKYIVDFQEKSEIFNTFLAGQCSPILNRSFLPSELSLRTENTLSTCHFEKEDILRVINNPDPIKDLAIQ